MKICFLFTLFILSSKAFAADLVANFTVDPINKNKIIFNLKNNSEFQYFCRSAKVEGVEFLDGDSSVYFDDITAENISLYPNENVSFPQSLTDSYKDIMDLYPQATIKISPEANVILDCEKKFAPIIFSSLIIKMDVAETAFI